MATSVSGIQGQLLEVTVVGCNKLKDTEWFSRQDPYVCLEYGSSKFRTRTCTDGGKHPTFQEKFVFNLIEGLRELNVIVWNSNSVTYDDMIGSGKIQLQKVLSQGYDDSPWSLQTKTGRSNKIWIVGCLSGKARLEISGKEPLSVYAGEVRLILHYPNANASSMKPPKNHAPSAPYGASPVPQSSAYSYPPPAVAAPYPPPPSAYPAYPSYPSYPQNSAAYPPTPYPPPHSAAYPPQPYPPPAAYPPSPYPPPSQPSNHYPPAPYPGPYPPPY